MPAKNHLSKEQNERLLKTLKEHENPYVREKIPILLLMNDGKTYQEISKFLDIAYPTVAYWAVHGDPDNLESFLDGRREGNFRKVTKEYENLLLEIIEKEPMEEPRYSLSSLRCNTQLGLMLKCPIQLGVFKSREC
ncbi:helix-turn-helix domain-containing protein [Nostoc sp.]|uniref:helix-turn-helix domain-containing protein n=1 Tax=Nostoc sp. TaxID=1180 RepID=UPI002FF815DA